jgi:hypothetical protein
MEPPSPRGAERTPVTYGVEDVQSITFSACKGAFLTTYAAPPSGPNVLLTCLENSVGA